MIINKDFVATPTKTFKDISIGDFFLYDGCIYLKLSADTLDRNTLKLDGYKVVFFALTTAVEPLYSELKLSKNPIISIKYPDYPWITTPIPMNPSPYWYSSTGKPVKLDAQNTGGLEGNYSTVYCEGVCYGS